MARIGLTGGIGSGKSTVAALLASLGAVVIDADALAREAVQPGSVGLSEVVTEFGPDVVDADGALDRAALAALVFADPAALSRLNAIVHPLVASLSAERLAAVPSDALVVYDVPLLAENGLQAGFDAVVVVDAPDDVRLRRLEARGLDRGDAERRMAAQASRDQRLAVADFVIDNSGDPDQLQAAVQSLDSELRLRLAEGRPLRLSE